MRVPKRQKEEDRRALSQQDYHVTKEKLESMKRTIERLKEERPKIVAELTEAREMGDLSENAAYTIAKSNLRRLDNRVLSLQERIKQAIIIEKSTDGKVGLGSIVVLDGPRGEFTYELVGPAEIDLAKGRISFQSPLGAVLMNKVVGETVELNGNTVGTVKEVK